METLNWVLILKSYEIVELKAYIYFNIRTRRLPQQYLPTFIYLYPQKQTNVTHCSRPHPFGQHLLSCVGRFGSSFVDSLK